MSQFKTFCIGLALMVGISLNAMAGEKIALASKAKAEGHATCIVCGAKIVDTKACPHMMYEGKDEVFCCKDCMGKFQQDPKKYISPEAKPAAMPAAAKADKKCGTTPAEEEPVDD